MRICRRALSFLFYCLLSLPAFSQDDAEGIVSPAGFSRFFTIGAGAVYQEFYDASFSSIRYQGFGVAPSFGHIKMKENQYSEVYLQPSYATLTRSSNKALSVKVRSYKALLDFRHLYRIKMRNERLDLRAGGLFSALYNHKKASNVAASGTVNEYALSLGISGRFAKEIELEGQRLAHLSWTVSLPLLAHYARPSYLNRVDNLDPQNKAGTDFFANSVTSFAGKKFLRLNSRVTYDYGLHNGNILALTYQWDYYKMGVVDKVHFAEHTVSVALMFNY